jgi:hypothetical protein
MDVGEQRPATAVMVAKDNHDRDPAGAVETNVAVPCRIVVGFEPIAPARVSFHTRGMVRIFAIRMPVCGRQKVVPTTPI